MTTNNDTEQPWKACKPSGRMLRPEEVIERTGLSRTLIYEMIGQERFPPFLKLGTRASGMPEDWLNAYFEKRAVVALNAVSLNAS